MPDVHAKLSASGAKKWINCPLSVQMESEFPDNSSAFAEEGTTAHALGEAKLRLYLKQYTRVQYHKAIKELEITEDMEEYTDGYRDFVVERLNAARAIYPAAQLLLEQRLEFDQWVPEGFGTGDAVIITPHHLEIIDLKYGKGVPVSAEGNPQLRLYALGAINAFSWGYDFKTVAMTIYQPRLDSVSSEEKSAEELIRWGDEVIRPAATLAFEGKGECCAGSHCDSGFCKARAVCRAYAEEKQKLATYDFKKPDKLSPDEIAEIIDLSEALASWAKLVKEYALDAVLNSGASFPGFKVVEGRSNRAYGAPEKEVAKLLTDAGYDEKDIYVRSLLGISAMEKFLSKKVFNELLGSVITKPPGKPTLVKSEDKRPAINSVQEALMDFEGVIS